MSQPVDVADSIGGDFLSTKLVVPQARSGLVARAKLVQALTSGLHQGTTLIVAPAGYGKTSVLIEWANTAPMPVAWLSCDDDDNDARRFLRSIIFALRNVDGAVGDSSLPILDASIV